MTDLLSGLITQQKVRLLKHESRRLLMIAEAAATYHDAFHRDFSDEAYATSGVEIAAPGLTIGPDDFCLFEPYIKPRVGDIIELFSEADGEWYEIFDGAQPCSLIAGVLVAVKTKVVWQRHSDASPVFDFVRESV
jgi:hypothetical protein